MVETFTEADVSRHLPSVACSSKEIPSPPLRNVMMMMMMIIVIKVAMIMMIITKRMEMKGMMMMTTSQLQRWRC